MHAYNIIDKKKKGEELTTGEIEFMVNGYLDDKIKDYQFSAFLMAIYFQGMTDKELVDLTIIMRDSGQILSYDYIDGLLVDKHSTGGVGDKTSLIVIPIAASAGVKICKMSGRGLGHTGGTIDKLEAIPGFRTELDDKEIKRIMDQVGALIIGQTANLAPADKKIYALRDATATVDSIPLIASSIMSKKLASSPNALVLDVKVGSGAFMKNLDEARELGEKMVKIGSSQGVKTTAVLTNMDQPLGRAVGNSLEIYEVVKSLEGKGEEDLIEISLELASHIIQFGLDKTLDEARKIAREELESGRAMDKFLEIVRIQGGDISIFDDMENFIKANIVQDIHYEEEGYIRKIDAEKIGLASKELGAGRDSLDDNIDFSAGIYLHKKLGDRIEPGDKIFTLYTSDKTKLAKAVDISISAFEIGERLDNKKNILDLIK